MVLVLGLCIVAVCNAVLGSPVDSQQADGRITTEQQPNTRIVPRQPDSRVMPRQPSARIMPRQPNNLNSHPHNLLPAAGSQKATVDNDLEKDLENVKVSKQDHVTNRNKNDIQNLGMYEMLADPDKDDLDIQLLYDLIQAVEYEANFQLFNKVLEDLDSVDTPGHAGLSKTEASPHGSGSSIKDKTQNAVNAKPEEVKNNVAEGSQEIEQGPNLMANAADTRSVRVGADRKGTVTAEEKPIRPRASLHKRIAVALRGMPMDNIINSIADNAKP